MCGRGWQGHRGGGSNILQAVGKHLVGLRLVVPASSPCPLSSSATLVPLISPWVEVTACTRRLLAIGADSGPLQGQAEVQPLSLVPSHMCWM